MPILRPTSHWNRNTYPAHRPSIKGTKLLFIVIKAIIIICSNVQGLNKLPTILSSPFPHYSHIVTSHHGTLSHCTNKRPSYLQTPPQNSPKNFHQTWLHVTLQKFSHTQQPSTHTCTTLLAPCNPLSPGPTLSPLTRGADTDKRSFSFFLFSSSVSRHRALSCCPRGTPSP